MIKPQFEIVPASEGSMNLNGWKIVDHATGKELKGFTTKAEAKRLVDSMEYFYKINN